MRKQTKIAALVSAAALLAIGASMTSFAEWHQLDDGQWEFLDKYGDPVYNEWKTYNGEWFYLGEDGVMLTDQIFNDANDHTFCVDAYGRRVKGWVSIPNEEGVDVNGKGEETSVLWMYFESNGKAVKSSDNTPVKKSLEWSGGKNYFLFNEEGYMLSGWYNDGAGTIYYLGTEDEGWARTGWHELEKDRTIDHVCPDDSDTAWYYFNPSTAKAYVDTDGEKYIDKKWYSFDEAGCLNTGWVEYGSRATNSNGYLPPAATDLVYNDVNGSQGYGWVYTSNKANDASYWYYLVTYRGTDVEGNAYAARSIAFGANGAPEGTSMTAKTINGKTYLFDGSDGHMVTGRQELAVATNGKEAFPNYSSDIKVLPAGTYYFNDPDDPKASTAGQLTTGKISVPDEDGVDYYYYYFAKKTQTYPTGDGTTTYSIVQGQAYTDVIVDGVLYGVDGKRIQAMDGNGYMLYKLPDPITYIKSGKAYNVEAGTNIAVSNTGRVKLSGSVKIEDITYSINSDTLEATAK